MFPTCDVLLPLQGLAEAEAVVEVSENGGRERREDDTDCKACKDCEGWKSRAHFAIRL